MNNKSIAYLGFSIDMDKAFSAGTVENIEMHQEKADYRDSFLRGMEVLHDFLNENELQEGATWLLNEHSYRFTLNYPGIIEECAKSGGEIGLHTHFNSLTLGGSRYRMSANHEDWVQKGLIEPKQRIEAFLRKINASQNKVVTFKSGNHIRNKEMYNQLVLNGFKNDLTPMIGGIGIRQYGFKCKILYNDLDLLMPFPYMKTTKSGSIRIIPDLNPGLLASIMNVGPETQSNIPVIRLQIHPDEVDNKLYPERIKILKGYVNAVKEKFDIRLARIDQLEPNLTVYSQAIPKNSSLRKTILTGKSLINHHYKYLREILG